MSRILAVGSVAYDTVETPFGSREDLLAGSATYFSLAASHFVPVAVVAAVGEDFRERDLGFLSSHGVDITGIERIPGRTFRWGARYSDDLNDRTTLYTELGVFAEFRARIPDEHRSPPFLFLGNIDPDLQRQVCEGVERPRLVACDTMNFWIEGKKEALLKTLKVIDLLVINDSEARLLTGEVNLMAAARGIRAMGPRSLVIKRGEYGAAVFTETFTGAIPALFLEDVVDPTGAGDSFAGGMLGCLAALEATDDGSLMLAVAAGSVMASFTVQGFGTEGLTRATPEAIRRRHRDLAALVGAKASPLPLRSAS
jgi:sugar/nucleoside kinase (ribokinase family)